MMKDSLSSQLENKCKFSGLWSLFISRLRTHCGIRTGVPGTKTPDPAHPRKAHPVETISQQAAKLSKTWQTDPRWKDTERTYSAEDVVRLRGTIQEEFTLARHGAERLRKLLAEEDAVTALGALTGNQAVQQVKAGLKAGTTTLAGVLADAEVAEALGATAAPED